jgi:hypothetical protein
LGGRREWGATERAAQVEAKLEARKQEVSYLPQRRRHRGGRTPIIDTVAGTGWWSPPLSLSLSFRSFFLSSPYWDERCFIQKGDGPYRFTSGPNPT